MDRCGLGSNCDMAPRWQQLKRRSRRLTRRTFCSGACGFQVGRSSASAALQRLKPSTSGDVPAAADDARHRPICGAYLGLVRSPLSTCWRCLRLSVHQRMRDLAQHANSMSIGSRPVTLACLVCTQCTCVSFTTPERRRYAWVAHAKRQCESASCTVSSAYHDDASLHGLVTCRWPSRR